MNSPTMTGQRFFQRVEGAETTNQPYYWTTNNQLLFEDVSIDVWITREGGRFNGTWIVKNKKSKRLSDWSSEQVISETSEKCKAKSEANKWMRNIIDKLLVDVSDVKIYLANDWEIVWMQSGDDAKPNHKIVELKRGLISRTLFIAEDEYQKLDDFR